MTVAGGSDTSSESEAASERMNEMSLSLDVDRVAVLCCRCAIDTTRATLDGHFIFILNIIGDIVDCHS